MYMDYEVSFFSDTGGYFDSATPSYMTKTVLDGYRKSVQAYEKKKTLAEATRAFFIDLGLTDAEIDAIYNNLTEDAG